MKKQFTLSVSTPCSEQWDTFLPTTTGAFCQSCNHEVIDFTLMSEKEIIQFFRNQSDGVCGRFQSDQLKTYEEKIIHSISPGWNLLKVGILALALMFAGQLASASNPPVKTPMEVIDEKQDDTNDPIQKDGITIQGMVTDENDAPFPGVNIYLKDNSTLGTVSDVSGNFQLSGNLKPGNIVIFSFLGYEPVEYLITKNIPTSLEISMSNFIVLMGKVHVDQPYQQPTEKNKLFQKVKSLF